MSENAAMPGTRTIRIWAILGLGTILVGGLLLVAALPSLRRRGPSLFL